MQAAFQKHVDNSVSKTINLPHAAALKDVEKAYLLAYELGTKGITIYRDGCREEQVLTKADAPDKAPARGAARHADLGHRQDQDRLRQPLRHDHLLQPEAVRGLRQRSARAATRPWPTPRPSAGSSRLALRSGRRPQGGRQPAQGHRRVRARSSPRAGSSRPSRTRSPRSWSATSGRSRTAVHATCTSSVCQQCGATLPDEKCPTCPNCGWNKCS